MGRGKGELARSEEIPCELRAADSGCGSRCREVLGLQPRIAALGSDVDEPKCAQSDGGQAERRPQDLPAAFPMRAVNDQRVGYLPAPGEGRKGSFNPLLARRSGAFKLEIAP
jgi:hypothetical protein